MTGKIRNLPWTDEQLTALDFLVEQGGRSWTQIGRACGHPGKSAKVTYQHRRSRAAAAGIQMPKLSRLRSWTQPEIDEMLLLREQRGYTFAAIGKRLGRSVSAVSIKYDSVRARVGSHGQPEAGCRVSVTPAALADRYARYQARLLQSPIAQLMGEPPPGHSALDKMRRGEAR